MATAGEHATPPELHSKERSKFQSSVATAVAGSGVRSGEADRVPVSSGETIALRRGGRHMPGLRLDLGRLGGPHGRRGRTAAAPRIAFPEGNRLEGGSLKAGAAGGRGFGRGGLGTSPYGIVVGRPEPRTPMAATTIVGDESSIASPVFYLWTQARSVVSHFSEDMQPSSE